ncbi:hypothetical protein A3F38_01285 [Candidatus Saccharibacteria bacterium RIFCSPHIGHO2_12_FULL_48_21]|nr:MAG: hypothetical protein A3F38_01285 [Candidatus Saccharibacteria bacterium RIFCSPHIGHO2_12_FULL_48_21]
MWPFKRSKNNQQATAGSWQNNVQPNPSLTSPSQQGLNRDIGPPPRMGGGGLAGGGSGRDDGYLGPPIPGGGTNDNLTTGGGLPLPGKQGDTTSGGTTGGSYGGAPYPGSSGDTTGNTINNGVGATITPGPGDGTSSGKPPGDVWIQGGGTNDNSRYVGPPATIRDNNPLPPPPNPDFSGPGGTTTTSFSSTNTNATLGNTSTGQTAGTSGPTTLSGAETRNQNTLDGQGSNPFGGFNSASGNKSTDVQ